MRPISVLHLRDTDEIGGPGKTILETHRAIDTERFRLHLGVFQTRHEREDTPFVTAAKAYGLPVHYLRGFNQYDPRLIWGVISLARRLGTDIVHAHEVKSDVIAYLASRLRRVPIMTTVHGWIGDDARSRMMIALDKRVARGYDGVIAVSGPIRDALLAAGVGPHKLHLLHNAIVLEKYRRQGRRGFVREATGRDVPGPIIVTIGRLSREKGHADFVEALGRVAAQGLNFSAVLAGDGSERPALEDRVRLLGLQGRVHFVGYVTQPQSLLEEADLMVLPSHTEGLPNAALEAMAMEVPVLATRVGGTPEVITDGESGRLVEPRSPQALALAIGDFLANREAWGHLATRGRQVVEASFSFANRTRKLERIYAGLAAGRDSSLLQAESGR